ncbi:hypothetical protein ACQPW1_15535 [Nocardia sp. CA-128927]|uniref:hypothetical protein n=1 Tax=Nocardia sp. CA-128927 TaxID=3239975 RepID=UPI003D951E8B
MSGDRSGGFFRRGRDVSGDRPEPGTQSGDRGSAAPGFGTDGPGTHDDLTGGPGSDRIGGFFRRSSGGGDQGGNPEWDTDSEDRTAPGFAGSNDDGPQAESSEQPKNAAPEGDPEDGLAEFAAELKLLAEAVLERVEPVLRQAADGQVEWSSCSWCPVCAAAALMRGQHHDVLQAVAEHGTALVTVLREALAGVPVDPVMPEHDPTGGPQHNHGVPQDNPTGATTGAEYAAGQHTSRASTRSRYVSIPVTIKA